MKFISIKRIKIYTKDALKLFNIALCAFGFIIAIVSIKYKPMYEVKISGQKIGYTNSKQIVEENIKQNIENYSGKNIDKVELIENPEYELKLVEKTKENDENEIIVALQQQVEITYKYYAIKSDNENIEFVDTLETAQQLVEDIKQKSEEKVNLEIQEESTTDIESIVINNFEVAEQNIIKKFNIDTRATLAKIEDIKVASLPISTGYISSRYGESSRLRSSTHTGLDIAAATGTKIMAVADGEVTFASYNGSYGNLVKIDHGNNVETWYAHASKIYVKVGQQIKAGDVIAAVGSTGNSTGAHLHFEVRINGQHVNPQKYLYK